MNYDDIIFRRLVRRWPGVSKGGVQWPYGPPMNPADVPPDSPPKPWEGEPITPKPEAYARLLAEFPAALAGVEAALHAVLQLHGPKPWMVSTTGTVDRWMCEGCDGDGYDAEYPRWPCRTTDLIARHLGVELAE